MKTVPLLIFAVVCQASGNVFLAKGMKQLGALTEATVDQWPGLALAGVQSPWIWLGIGLLLAFVFSFSILLSWADLSLVLPILSIEVVVNVAFAWVFLGESVSLFDWLGTAIVAAGVFLVAGTAGAELESARGREARR